MNYTEGDKCPSIDCLGKLEFFSDEACSCHINPPCSACVDAKLTCDNCGEEAQSGDDVYVAGYKNQHHKDIADFVFKHIEEGRQAYHSGKNRPQYGGNDVRHVLQAHGWVYEEHLTLNGKGLKS